MTIHLALGHLASQLNQHMRRAFHVSEDIVLVSNLVGADGAPAPNVNNKIVLFLTTIERDAVAHRASDGIARGVAGSQPLYLNLYVMIAANFTGSNYAEALKFISIVISFFQKQMTFDQRNSPDLDKGIEKLILDIENLTPHQLSNVWGVLGGRYLPSVLYRVRMITVDSDAILGRVPMVADPSVSLAAQDR